MVIETSLMSYLPKIMVSLFCLGLTAPLAAAAKDAPIRIQVVGLLAEKTLVMNDLSELKDASGRAVSVSRLDFLMTKLAFQELDGTWAEAEGWRGFFRGNEPGSTSEITNLKPGKYRAIRFSIGVEKEANHQNPNRLAVDDPLHPVSNGLHWGWQGGYIFMALEGHWQLDGAAKGLLGGFSYHLGNDPNYTEIEVRGEVELAAGKVLALALDAKALLAGIDIVTDGESTHSRTEDRVVAKLRKNLKTAFAIHRPVVDSELTAVTSGGTRHRGAQRGTLYPISAGANLPQINLPPDNLPTVEGVRLGESLFHDKRLSKDRTLSCASCHVKESAFSDPDKAFSVGVGGKLGGRNAMPIFNLAWATEFFWDGRAKGLRTQALMPIQDAHEMAETLPEIERKLGADPAKVEEFRRVFGDGAVTAERVGLALEQFMLTLISQDSKFDRVTKGQGAFSPEEKRGFELFLTEHDPFRGLFGADCFHCHGGSLFTTNQFFNNGLPLLNGDVGREKVTREAADRGKFRTPSLRNVELTGPYMHDGRFKTLEEVVEHYDHGVQKSGTLDPNLAKHPEAGLKLSAEDKKALVAFMKTLTDPGYRPKNKVVGRP